MAFSPSGSLALSAGGSFSWLQGSERPFGGAKEDNSVRLWDVDNGRELGRFTGHHAWVWCVAFPDGRYALSGSADKTPRFWRLPK